MKKKEIKVKKNPKPSIKKKNAEAYFKQQSKMPTALGIGVG